MKEQTLINQNHRLFCFNRAKFPVQNVLLLLARYCLLSLFTKKKQNLEHESVLYYIMNMYHVLNAMHLKTLVQRKTAVRFTIMLTFQYQLFFLSVQHVIPLKYFLILILKVYNGAHGLQKKQPSFKFVNLFLSYSENSYYSQHTNLDSPIITHHVMKYSSRVH